MRAESVYRCCSTHGSKLGGFAPALVEHLPCLIVLHLVLSTAAFGQGSGQGPTGRPADIDTAAETSAGQVMQNYVVMQSVELGGRITSLNGSGAMFNTLLNEQSGPRLFQQTLMIRPMPNSKAPFDNLYFESFGWGGDPSNAARLRVTKRGLYNLGVSFRRDKNYFDYDLLANPLNATSTTTLPTILVDSSPHSMYLTRRMYDFNLVLLPQHTVSFRIDYNRSRNEGPSFSSVHEGTEALLNQQFSTTQNDLRLGVSWRVLPRTTLSFTESLQFLKNDTDQTLAAFHTVLAANGTPVEFGLPWLNGSPGCIPSSATAIVGGFANPSCNGYLSYSRTQRFRNYLPSEQVNLSSNSIRNVDLTARFMYSNADTNTPLSENFDGLVTRTGLRASNTNGTTAHATWVSEDADAGVTIHLGSHVRVVDSFRYYAYRIPGVMYLLENNFFNLGTVTTPNILQPVATFPVTPFHSASSPADVQNDVYNRFVQQSTKSNEFALHYDVSRYFGVRVGYRYRNIFDAHQWLSTSNPDTYFPDASGTGGSSIATATCLAAGGVVGAGGICTVTGPFDSENEPVTINQHWAIAGVWYRMAEKFRVDAEARIMSADNYLTRIDPRHEQQYRANASFTPKPWLTVAANLNLKEQRNPTQDFAYDAHIRNFGFNAIASPNSRITVDAAYNYTSTVQNNNICYTGTFVAPGSAPCTNDNTLQEVLGFYSNRTHYGSANVLFKPVRRVSVIAGYSIINVDGNELILNLLQPLGPLSYRYHQPVASVGVELTKQIELRGGWNYYQYNENSFTGPTAPRYFHANLTNVSLKYSF
jgi:hypothetical protein